MNSFVGTRVQRNCELFTIGLLLLTHGFQKIC